MRRPPRTDKRSRIRHGVLAYLAEHPESQDTLEGIIGWWLLEQEIERQTALVRQVLEELVEQGLLVEQRGADGRTRYQTNREKLGEICRQIEAEAD